MPGKILLREAALILALIATVFSPAIAQTNVPVVTPASDLHPSRQVLAFYYTWYGPNMHWEKVDAAHHDISAARHYPEMGAYDSHDPKVIAKHIADARKVGITGFICTWWGQGSYEDQAVPLTLAAAQGKNFNVTVYWESAPGDGQAQIDNAVSDLVYLVKNYGTNSAFLKVDGKPVIFIYGRVMGQVPLAAWRKSLARPTPKSAISSLFATAIRRATPRFLTVCILTISVTE